MKLVIFLLLLGNIRVFFSFRDFQNSCFLCGLLSEFVFFRQFFAKIHVLAWPFAEIHVFHMVLCRRSHSPLYEFTFLLSLLSKLVGFFSVFCWNVCYFFTVIQLTRHCQVIGSRNFRLICWQNNNFLTVAQIFELLFFSINSYFALQHEKHERN